MPVRTIPLSRSSVTGRHNPGRGARAIAFESTLERDFILLMRFDPDVEAIEEQPVRISYRDEEGKSRHNTPDFLVTRSNGANQLVEVKPSSRVTPDLDMKFHAAREFSRSRGWKFELWTEKEIRIPRLENAVFLKPFNNQSSDEGVAQEIEGYLSRIRDVQIGRMFEELWPDEHERAHALPTVWAMIADGTLSCDLDRVIDGTSKVWFAAGGNDAGNH